jgi:hypothetical protein
MTLAPNDTLEITPKGKMYLSRIEILPFSTLHAILKSLQNKPQPFENIRTMQRTKVTNFISTLADKKYITVISAPGSNRKTTHIDLVNELTARNPLNHVYDRLIKNAQSFLYHDIKSTDDNPKLLLEEHLRQFPELNDIRDRVIQGEFNEPWR